MVRFVLFLVVLGICVLPNFAETQLKEDFYLKTCPNVESIVRKVVIQKVNETFVTVPATLRLFFHDCMVYGCDASVLITSTEGNTAEKDHPDNLSLAGDAFDTVIKAKAAVDKVSGCKNKVSCADILSIATRDVIYLAGGPFYPVELGRRDGLVSTAASVDGKLPKASFNLKQLTSLFGSHGLSQADMIALSAAHTVGYSHCNKFANRLYNYSSTHETDPTLNTNYAAKLKEKCPKNVDPRMAVDMDPRTPTLLDNNYFWNLIQRKGLFTSDQVLYDDPISRPVVVDWAHNGTHFRHAFAQAMIKLGRVGVKTGKSGNIRVKCDAFNY
ncbi:peroxidase 51-like [Silene latifolia]|uniref:peroxidase 51-like n=1 Tax=Silene latifolia TaxID=37657 RepID=UPI003D78400C